MRKLTEQAKVTATYLGTNEELRGKVPEGAIRVDDVWYSIEDDGSVSDVTLMLITTRTIGENLSLIRGNIGKYLRKYEVSVSSVGIFR